MPTNPADSSPARRTKTPPELKWLLNERAALVGRLARQQKALVQQRETVTVAEQALLAARSQLAILERQTEDTRTTVRALEVSTQLGFPGVNPADVPLVKERTRFGRRGALVEFLLQAVTEAGCQGIPTARLTNLVRDAFGVPTTNRNERQLLLCTVRNRLKELRDLHGLVIDERGPTSNSNTTWRRVASPTFTDLLGLAPAARHGAPAAANDSHTSHADAIRREVAGERARGAGGPDAAD